MNRIMPYLRPCLTANVWLPWYVDSRTMSRHQTTIVMAIRASPPNSSQPGP